MKTNKKIVAIVPAFNEGSKIREVVKVLRKYVNEVVVVDDGSTDDTSESVSGLKVTVLRHVINLGQGAAIQTGLEFAKKINADIVITFDADGQFKSSEIPSLVKPVLTGKADVVLGSRFLGKTVNMPASRKLLLKCAILFTKLYSGISLTDTHNGLRAMNKNAYTRINITQNRMSHASEIIQQINASKLRYIEVPVTVTYNKYSRAKGQNLLGSLDILLDLTLKKLLLE